MTSEPSVKTVPTGCDDSCCGGVSTERLLRELGTYSLEWQLDGVLDDLNGERLDRAEVARRISARTLRDPHFRDEVLRHPRWVYMVALVEAFGVSKLAFLRQIREVRSVVETETLLYFVLPVQREREVAFLGEQLGSPAVEPARAEPTDVRDAVERDMIDDAQSDDSRRQALLFRPHATYLRAAKKLCGGELPPYLRSVREIRVVPETPRSLGLVVRTVGVAS